MNPFPPSPVPIAPPSLFARGERPTSCRLTACDGGEFESCNVVVSRSLGESDWEMIRAFVRNTERNDLRLRFGVAIDFRDEASLRRHFGVNPNSGEIGWILDERSLIAGISHRVLISPFEAEIALIVRSDLKRKGIGSRMLNCLIRRSGEERLQTVSAWVLYENRAMLSLARRAGFVARGSLGLNVELAIALGRRGAH
jgi:RimJ/RimL family protein N-acetyltransferase